MNDNRSDSNELLTLLAELELYRNHNSELLKSLESYQLQNYQLNEQLSELEAETLVSENRLIDVESDYEFYKAIFDNYSGPVAIIDNKGGVALSNHQFRTLMQKDEISEVKKKFIFSFFEKSSSIELKKALLRLSDDAPQRGVLELHNNTSISYQLSKLKRNALTDFNILTLSEMNFNSQDNYLFRLSKLSIEQMKEGLMITDVNHQIVFVNQSFTEITGYTFNDAVGNTPSILSSGRHPNSFYNEMYDELNMKGWWSGEIWNKRKNGQIYPEFIQITRAFDSISNSVFYIASFSDITARKSYQQHLDRLAFFDSLTSLPNRASLENYTENLINRMKPKLENMFAFVFLDLDQFKAVNDTYGHPEGDQVLREAAQRIIATIRTDDFAARIGGDEFVIVFSRITSKKDVLAIVEKLIKRINKPFIGKNAQHHLGTSIGVSFFPEDGIHAEDLMRRADAAMYYAKQNGRNQYRVFDSSFEKKAEEEVHIQSLINSAIKSGSNDIIFMNYQPLFEASDITKPKSFECLVRMQDHDGNLINPERFISLAEDNSLIADLGQHIFKLICKDIQQHFMSAAEIEFEVNLSPLQFLNPSLLDDLKKTAKQHDIPFKRFNFEITETATMENLSIMLDTLEAIKAEGCNLLLDDFGTGYASLSMLKNLPTNIIKIDRSFVHDLEHSGETQNLVRALINMAKSLKLSIVAEGVETQNQFEWLRNYGVDYFQGYWFSKPKRLNEFNYD